MSEAPAQAALSDATASSVDRKIGEKEFTINTISIKGWGEIEAWCKEQIRAEAKEMLDICGDDPPTRMSILKKCAEDLNNFSLDDEQADVMLSSFHGACQLVSRAVTKVDGKPVTPQEAVSHVNTMNLAEVVLSIHEVNAPTNPPKALMDMMESQGMQVNRKSRRANKAKKRRKTSTTGR